MILGSFWIALAIKAAFTACVVVGALAAAEAAGPFWGGLIASFPISAGPAYVLLALQHGSRFIAASALESFAINAGTWLFLLVLIRLAPRVRWSWALGGALGTWLAAAAVIQALPWTAGTALALNLLLLGAALGLTRGHGQPVGTAPRGVRRWFDLPLRALLVATLVTTVVTGSRVLGPRFTGLGAVFPIAFSSLGLLALTRLGGATTAALMASALRALPGFALALLVLHLGAMRFGSFPAMGMALGVNALWALGVLARRRRAMMSAPALVPVRDMGGR